MNEAKRPSVMIATPMYGGMCTGGYALSLLGAWQTLTQLKCETYIATLMNESLITRGRNDLARMFLERDADYLMFIDADITFPKDAIPALLLADKDVVCGVYSKKEIAWDSVSRAAQAGKSNLAEYSGSFVLNMIEAQGEHAEVDDSGVIEVRHGGTGFMLIKRSVLEKLKDHVPTYRRTSFRDQETGEYIHPVTHQFFDTSIDGTGALLSEDYHFCELWRKHGGKIHVNPAIKLEHTGTYVFGGDLMKSGGNLK
jgi:hypothetical protein